MKCEDVMPSATTNEPTCKLCRESGLDCTFETPVRKRYVPYIIHGRHS